MSFRRTVFIALSVAALVMVALEGAIDLVLDGVADRQAQRNAALLDEAVEHVVAEIFTGPPPMDEPQTLAGRPVRYTVSLVDIGVNQAAPEVDTAQPPRRGGRDRWISTTRSLGFARSVEVELELSVMQYALANRRLLDVVDLPVFLVIAMATALLLTRLVARPVRRLTEATRGIAVRRFDEVSVPPGSDELSELANAFNAMSREIQGFLDRERAFSRYVSHELRTPLSALRLQLDRVALGHASADTVVPVLGKHVARMEGIIEGLLTLARMSDPDPQVRALGEVVGETLASFAPEARARIRLVDDSHGHAVSHTRLLQRAVHNLIDNALRHTRGPVTVGVGIDRRQVLVTVEDAGPGVPESAVERLTQPFFRLADDATGLGLGLSLVALIARAVGGTIDLRNEATGLVASLRLPIVVDAATFAAGQGSA